MYVFVCLYIHMKHDLPLSISRFFLTGLCANSFPSALKKRESSSPTPTPRSSSRRNVTPSSSRFLRAGSSYIYPPPFSYTNSTPNNHQPLTFPCFMSKHREAQTEGTRCPPQVVFFGQVRCISYPPPHPFITQTRLRTPGLKKRYLLFFIANWFIEALKPA